MAARNGKAILIESGWLVAGPAPASSEHRPPHLHALIYILPASSSARIGTDHDFSLPNPIDHWKGIRTDKIQNE